ncbi:MAG: hypothetical protein JWO06_2758 [Bacteroidota bacterium]|nr:hypothetical protein [Bacteroidota bacterium]
MKLTLAFIALIALLAFGSCQKCVTCTPYRESGLPSNVMQTVKSCNKVDIAAYEKGPFVEPNGDSVIIFKCI